MSPLRIVLFFTFFLICRFNLIGQGHFTITEEIRQAYETILELRLDEGEKLVQRIKEDDPQNLLIYHIENYIDFFKIFISEEKSLLFQLESNKKTRLEKIKEGDKNSPFYRFSQAEILLQWALARSKFYDDAAIVDLKLLNEINSAYRLLEDNDKRYPSFIANKKSLSLIHALASYMPGVIKKLFKIKGSLDLGRTEIELLNQQVLNTDFIFKNEVHAIYTYMLLHLFNKPEQAWENLQFINKKPDDDPLICFLYSTVAIKTGRTEFAHNILEKRPKGEGYFHFYYLDYLLGKCKLYKQDSSADLHIKYFLEHFNGRHFIKDAYQKLAWYELTINKSLKGYDENIRKCKKMGRNFLEDDQQALTEQNSRKRPNSILLKARLWYDGGYYEKALSLLEEKSYTFSATSTTYLEFSYRKARILHALMKTDQAIDWYLSTIQSGVKKKSFYSANAALQIALIYEKREDTLNAKKYFTLCLDIDPDIYEEQLHNKAKAGLARINGEI